MSEEKSPVWKPNLLKADEPTTIKITSQVPITEGKTKYGLWEMYGVQVNNTKVSVGKEIIEAYSGEAIMFVNLGSPDDAIPPPKIYQKIKNELSKGNTTLTITKKAVEGKRGGFYTDYVVTPNE